jgi:O-antigen/teichoic acid export membrane protein
MNTAQRIVKNTFSLLLSGFVAQLFIFFTMIYLARVLGPGYFGKISFATALLAYFTLITHLGLPLWGTREIARDSNNIRPYLGNILLLRLCLAALSFILLLLLLFFLQRPIELKILILLYGIGLFFSAITIDWVFQGIEKMEYVGLGRILSALTFFGLVILFIKGQAQLYYVPCFQVAGILLGSLILIVVFIRTCGRFRLKFDLQLSKKILKQALPLGVSIILIQIIYSIDIVMLGFMKSDVEVGYYNAAYKIILPLILVGSIYFDAVFPVLSKYHKSSMDSLEKLQSYNAKLMTIAALPLGISGTMLGVPIVTKIYGTEYLNSAIAFQILIWAAVLIYLNMIYARGMWACNMQNKYLKIVFGQAVINIILNCLLIPHYGIIGAAVSTVAAEFVGLFFYQHEFNKIVHLPIHHFILKPILASLLTLLFLAFTKHLNLIVVLGGVVSVYFAALFCIKGISKDEIKNIAGVLVFERNR